jgi:SAM-dependent methyltransferase
MARVEPGPYTLGHYVLGIAGLALLRSAGSADGPARERLVTELAAVLARLGEAPFSATREAPPIDRDAGYAVWAASYDTPGNTTIELEQDVVRELVGELPGESVVLDAACGTGRHAAYLAELGHTVVGVDSSAEMLALAAAKVPGGRFVAGTLEALPLEDASVDAAVCALALSHARDIRPAVAELARVLRPGGRLVVSNPHPLATGLLGRRATVQAADGTLTVIPEYAHGHEAYVDAFAAAGLEVERCIEPALDAAGAAAQAQAGLTELFRAALTGFPVVIVWEVRRQG